ncbi:hypothetical protein SG26_20045 (plasmid) [Haloarcula sp. CBA1115]|uniref:hypothetical protein n=1 Tax=unclassified Haloarcula TaxID=2624677 RepID=UPI000595587F|nr:MULTISPECIES: hypothetical protein [unclassified Haloarcula]AJF28042.1 hypothetical protein SG26_20045 [Haloarcula sp. CBA1115]
MTATDPTQTQDGQPDQQAGFDFSKPGQEHEIEVSYSWGYVDTIYMDDDGELVRSQDTDGYYRNDESFECTCGETFGCESKAKSHIRSEGFRGPPVPVAGHPEALRWENETITDFGGNVEFIPDVANTAGKVVSGADYLIATARTTLTPPADHGFDSWEPLQSGRLANHRGDPLFSARLLSKAIATLSTGHQYVPERYTLYFRGHTALYLEGPGGGILIAERLPSLD